MAGLIDEPYELSMDEITKLTLRQIEMMYYRKRNKHGVPHKISGTWHHEGSDDFAKEQFYDMGINVFGKTLEELDAEWELEVSNGESV